MFVISEHQDPDLTPAQVRAVVSLLNRTWPRPDTPLDALIEEFHKAAQKHQRASRGTDTAPVRYVIWEGHHALALANTFERIIFTATGRLGVMALAGVCVATTHRGKGLGAAITKKALARVEQKAFPVSLFRTQVPGFYEKLGARIVHNPFINSKNKRDPEADPWEGEAVMIYPAPYPWPDGLIDLNGRGY